MMEELANTPGAVPHYLEIVKKFEGEVTKSAVNTDINPLFSYPHPSPPPPTQKSYLKPPWLRQKTKDHKLGLLQERSTLRPRLQMIACHPDYPLRDPHHTDWHCHHCHRLGHIR